MQTGTSQAMAAMIAELKGERATAQGALHRALDRAEKETRRMRGQADRPYGTVLTHILSDALADALRYGTRLNELTDLIRMMEQHHAAG